MRSRIQIRGGRHHIFGAVVGTLLVFWGARWTWSQQTNTSPNPGAAIATEIQQSGAVSNYMRDRLRVIAQALYGGGVQINAPYEPQLVNVYVVDAQRARPILRKHKRPAVGRGVALEPERLVLISQDHLRELVTLAFLAWERQETTGNAVAKVAVQGLKAWRTVWDPAANPSLSQGQGSHWEIALRGAVAFLLAHEVAHVQIGRRDPANVRRLAVFRSDRDRDIHWACPHLLDARAAQHRSIEEEADAQARALLARHRIGGSRIGRYEVGQDWYMLVLGEMRYACAVGTVKSPEVRAVLDRRYGAPLVAALSSGQVTTCPESGAVEAFYPADHPSVIQRYLLRGSSPVEASLLKEFQLQVDRECARLASRTSEASPTATERPERSPEYLRGRNDAQSVLEGVPTERLPAVLKSWVRMALSSAGHVDPVDLEDDVRRAQKKIVDGMKNNACVGPLTREVLEDAASTSAAGAIKSLRDRPVPDGDIARIAVVAARLALEMKGELCTARSLHPHLK